VPNAETLQKGLAMQALAGSPWGLQELMGVW